MLEELQRRNYSSDTIRSYSGAGKIAEGEDLAADLAMELFVEEQRLSKRAGE